MRTRVGLDQRQARRLAWMAWGLGLCLFLAVVVFSLAGWGRCGEAWRAASTAGDQACRILIANDDIGGAAESLGFGLMGLLFATLGMVVATRRKGNAIGWIFLATGLVFVANAFVTVYTVHVSEAPGALPAALGIAVAAEILGGPIVFAPFVLFFLLFPDGTVLSRRWRWAVIAVVLSMVLQSLTLGLHSDPLRLAPLHVNPVGVAFLTGAARAAVDSTAFALLLGSLLASVVSLVLRFRRSRGVERQQMKWFTTSSAFVGLVFVFAPLFWATPQLEVLWGPLFLLATASVPIAATIAILKYRLYDLSVIINRALVYGTLTGLLGAIYLGLVVLMQAVLTGVGGGTDIAVAASTLAVAALFRPARRRLQGFIDHRFYRRKYNALRTVESFSSHLRQETDLTALRGELLGAVHETVQPARAVLWLQGEPSG